MGKKPLAGLATLPQRTLESEVPYFVSTAFRARFRRVRLRIAAAWRFWSELRSAVGNPTRR